MKIIVLSNQKKCTNAEFGFLKILKGIKYNLLPKGIILFLLILSFFINKVTATIIHPCFSSASCTANDFTLTEVYLASDNLGTRLTTVDCNGTLPLSAYYVVKIANSTSSQRLGVYVDARVSIGGVISNLTYCFDATMPANAIQTLIVPTPIFWDCSAPISITESLIFWSTASGPVCPGNVLDCGPTSPSKCRGGGTFPVNTPLVSNFTYNGVCNAGQNIQTITYTDSSFGGDYPSVTYQWNFGSGATPSVATTKGPHVVSYTTAGVKNVTLTVTNADGSNDTRSKIIVAGNCCVFNVSCPAPFSTLLCCEQLIPPAATTKAQLETLGFTINVCGSLGIISSDVRVNGNCANNYTINRTYTVFDDLNSNQIKDANESFQTCTQTITVQDNTKPVFVGN